MTSIPCARISRSGMRKPQFTFNFEEIDLRKPYAKE